MINISSIQCSSCPKLTRIVYSHTDTNTNTRTRFMGKHSWSTSQNIGTFIHLTIYFNLIDIFCSCEMNFLPCLQTVQYSKFATPKTNSIVTTCCSGIINYRQNIRSLQHQKLTFFTNSVVPSSYMLFRYYKLFKEQNYVGIAVSAFVHLKKCTIV